MGQGRFGVADKNTRIQITPRLAIFLTALAFVLLEFSVLHWLQPVERWLQDQAVQYDAARRTPDPDIVLVALDERSLVKLADEFGFYPWPRSIYAELLEGILRQQPRAVIFDIVFSDPDIEHPDADRYFMQVATADPRVYFPMVRLVGADDSQGVPLAEASAVLGFLPTEQARNDAHAAMILPLRPLAETGRVGLINFFPDADGVGRHYPLYLEVGGWRLPSLAARVVQDLGYALPDRQMLGLRWTGKPQHRPRLSLVDVLHDLGRQDPQGLGAQVQDKIVFIGATAPQLHDSYATPISTVHPGVDIFMTALGNLKNSDWLRPASAWYAPLFSLLLLSVLAVLFHRGRGPLWGGVLLLVLTPAAIGATFGALTWRGWLLPSATPLLIGTFYYVANALHDYLHERRARQHAVSVFSRFVDSRVVDTLVREQRDMLETRGDNRIVTVLFSDIRGFTTLSETRPPEAVVALLNDYFSRQVEVIFRHGGTVDKFIGDAIMALWGAPLPDAQQAEHAVRAALDMVRALEDFRQAHGELGRNFDIGIGIHTGPAVIGFIGAPNKLDYTAIGDTVNLASRIEGQTKGRARILVSDATCDECGVQFEFISHGAVQVKGRAKPVNLFEPTGGKS